MASGARYPMIREIIGGKLTIGANPKSVMEASRSWLRRTLEDLMLPWMDLGPSEWMWAIPLAAPREIFTLESQLRGVPSEPLKPVKSSGREQLGMLLIMIMTCLMICLSEFCYKVLEISL